MGSFFSRYFSRLFGRGEVRILILGLENAGKTTFLYQLQFHQAIDTIPTIGFNVESVQFKNIILQMWDLGGQKSFREQWKCYYPNTQGVIYMLDSTDWARADLARQELFELLHEDDLKNTPVLVLANKQDLPGAMSTREVENRLQINTLQRKVFITGISAKMNTDVESALNWLIDNIDN